MAPALGETVMFQVAAAIEALSDDIGRPVLEVVSS
jgi:hypothetical protein